MLKNNKLSILTVILPFWLGVEHKFGLGSKISKLRASTNSGSLCSSFSSELITIGLSLSQASSLDIIDDMITTDGLSAIDFVESITSMLRRGVFIYTKEKRLDKNETENLDFNGDPWLEMSSMCSDAD